MFKKMRLITFSYSVLFLFTLFCFASDNVTYKNNFGRDFLLGANNPVEASSYSRNKAQVLAAKKKNDALNLVAINSIRAICKLLEDKDLSFFDATDGANQCHLNTLLVVKLANDKSFRNFCKDLSSLSDEELMKKLTKKNDVNVDYLKLLSLSALRYVIDRQTACVREHTFDELVKLLDLGNEKYAQSFLKNSQRFQRAGKAIGMAICQELADLRLRLYKEEIENNTAIKVNMIKNGVNMSDDFLEICYDGKLRNVGTDTIKTIPKFLSLLFFMSVYPEFAKQIPIYIQFVCDNKIIGYADSSLDKFLPNPGIGPTIAILMKSISDLGKNAKVDPNTGLLNGYSPRDVILMGGAYFVEKYQPEGKDLSRKYIRAFDKVLQKYLDVQRSLGIEILHFKPLYIK